MKVKLYIIASLLWLIPVVFGTCYAADCTPETKTEMKNAADTDAKKAISDAMSAYEAFKKDAENFLNCESGVEFKKGSTFEPSSEMDVKARELGVSVWPSDKYKYSAYDWAKLQPTDAKCAPHLSTAKVRWAIFLKYYSAADQLVRAAKTAQSDKECECDENGQESCHTVGADTNEAANQDSECKPFTGYLQEMTDMCPLCAVFEVILNADAKISMIAWNGTAQPLSNVVKIFFFVLLALEALKAVSAIAGTRLSSFLKNLLTIGLKVAIAIILLNNVTYIYSLFISPVLSGGLDMGMAIAYSSGAGECAAVSPSSPIQAGALDSEILSNIYSTVRCFGNSAATMPALGRGLLCNALTGGILSWDIGMWFSGLIMLIFGLMIWLAVSFYLIDCTVQLAFFTALVPLFIAFWPFKLTQSYTVKGVKLMMNTFFNFAMIGVILLIATHIVSFALSGNGDFDYNAMIDAMNNNDAAALKENTKLDCLQIIVLLACCICALKLLSATNKLADQFSKGAGADIAPAIGGLAASAATSVGLAGTKLTAKALGNATKAAYEGSLLKSHVDSSVDSARKAWARGWQRVGQSVGLGQYQSQQTTGSGKPDTGGSGGGHEYSGDTSGNDDNYMFPPETHDTGNAEMDERLNRQEREMQNGYDTGNTEVDKKMNDDYNQHLEYSEERGQALGMSGKEYREIDAIKQAFRESDEGKEVWQKYEKARKKSDKSPEAIAALKEFYERENNFVKNNFNRGTYHNYRNYEQANPDNLFIKAETQNREPLPAGNETDRRPEDNRGSTGSAPDEKKSENEKPQTEQPQSQDSQTAQSQSQDSQAEHPQSQQPQSSERGKRSPTMEQSVENQENATGKPQDDDKDEMQTKDHQPQETSTPEKQSDGDEVKQTEEGKEQKEENIERAERKRNVEDGKIVSEDTKKKS